MNQESTQESVSVDDGRSTHAASGGEQMLEILGALLMAVGVGLAVVAYIVAGNQNSGDLVIDDLEHNEHIILAIIGVSVALVGATLFLRSGLVRALGERQAR